MKKSLIVLTLMVSRAHADEKGHNTIRIHNYTDNPFYYVITNQDTIPLRSVYPIKARSTALGSPEGYTIWRI